jgi:hypothetical protein
MYPIELGAKFVQGLDPELLAAVRASGLMLTEMQGVRWQAAAGRWRPHPVCGPDLETAIAALPAITATDSTLRDFVEANLPGRRRARARQMPCRVWKTMTPRTLTLSACRPSSDSGALRMAFKAIVHSA